jgi:cbb3-type cytochrome c oxidase subunit III
MTRAIVKFAALASLALAINCAARAEDAATPAAKAPDVAKGQAIAGQVCAACHGADGNAIAPTFPKLAGQHAEYLYKELTNFKSGERANAVMGPYAAALSDDDMHNVAAYFEAQTQKPASAQDKAEAALGQKIYRAGIAAKSVPACAGCHSPNGAGIPAQYPRLAGQWQEYAQAQLTAFRGGVRNNNAAMMAIASRLSDDEMKAVADYVAGLR